MGVPAVGGLKFSMAQNNLQKVPVGGIAPIFILIHFYLINYKVDPNRNKFNLSN